MSKDKNRVPEPVARRMPKYYGFLTEMEKNGIRRVSSKQLSETMGLTASQIRQDFNSFGGFGQQGYGYNVSELRQEIKKILGLHRSHDLVVVGAGNLGRALTNYSGFEKEGFYVRALFDVDPQLIGTQIKGIEIQPWESIKEYTSNNSIDIAVICTPKDKCRQVATILMDCGIRNIWNFSPSSISTPPGVMVENVNLNDSLFTLSFRLNETAILESKE